MRNLLIIMALLALSAPVLAAPHRCAGAVVEALDNLGVTPEQVKRTVFISQTDDGQGRSIVTGYEAWIDLKSCKGTLVAKMYRQCGIWEIYSRGACDFSGLKNYR
jgi:hypothetical protein